jgi:cobalt/nickel transport system permease protein
MNTRVKFIFTLVFLLCLNFSPSGVWSAYIFFFTLVMVGLLLSRLSLRLILVRSLISLPFVLAAAPLLFLGPAPRVSLGEHGRIWITISQPGTIRFLSISIKAWISVLAAILLSSSTKFGDLLSGMRQMGIPKEIVAILALMWRYLSLMIAEAFCLMRARNSRSGTPFTKRKTGGSLGWRASVTGKMAGNLLFRSLERSERIYAAMLARGYNGEVKHAVPDRITKRDWIVFLISSLLSIAILALAVLIH